MSDVFVGQTLKILLNVSDQDGAVMDISSATLLIMRFCLPDGTTFDRTAAFETDGTDGKITYTTTTDDLSIAGEWEIQGLVSIGTQFYPTSVSNLIVRKLGC